MYMHGKKQHKRPTEKVVAENFLACCPPGTISNKITRESLIYPMIIIRLKYIFNPSYFIYVYFLSLIF